VQFAFNRAIDAQAKDKPGHVDLFKLLLSLDGDMSVDVHADTDRAFTLACQHGRVDVMELLLSLEGDRRIDVARFEAIQASRSSVVALVC